MAASARVVAVVLNWNNYDDTATCLDRLATLSYPALETIVVDNGSGDGSGERLEADYPDVDVLFNAENRGFSGGMNRGIEAALDRDPSFVWLLNNDLLVEAPDLLDDLVARLREETDLGVVSPLVYSYPDTDHLWFWRGVVDWNRGYAYHARGSPPSGRELVATDYVPVCCALFPAQVFETVGRLPERYFLYYADVDFAVQLADAGYRLATDTAATVYHRQGGSSGSKLGPTYSYYNGRNAILFARRYGDRVGRLAPFWHAAALAKKTGHRVATGNVAGVVGLFRGVWDGIRGIEDRGPYP